MKITYGDVHLRIKYIYIFIVILVFITDALFSTFIFGKMEPDEPAPVDLEKFIVPFFFVIAFLNFHNLNNFLKGWTLFISLYLIVLMFESYIKYNSFFIYPHVFSKILVLYFIPSGYIFFRKQPPKSLDVVVYLVFFGFILHLLLFELDTLSVNAFTNTERGFTAFSAYSLVLVLVYFYNKYLSTSKLFFLFLFFLAAFFLAFLNHRSTWVASAVALFISTILVRKSKYHISIATILPMIFIPIIGIFLAFSFVLSMYPEILTSLAERFADIGNAEETGTGRWRLDQFEAYMPIIYDNPIVGLRLEGFELPIQFFEEHTGLQPWPDGTGHHFHSFYMDRLFYFGVMGLIFFIPIIFYMTRIIIQKVELTLQEIVLISYTASGIIFGLSYNWPTYFYFFIGMAIGYMYQYNTESKFNITENNSDFKSKTLKLNLSKAAFK